MKGLFRRVVAGAIVLLCGMTMGPVWAETASPETETRIFFEPSSNRLSLHQDQSLDRLSNDLLKRGQTGLILLVPTADDDGLRRFILSRVTVIERELDRRGIIVERHGAMPFSARDDFLVLQSPAQRPEKVPVISHPSADDDPAADTGMSPRPAGKPIVLTSTIPLKAEASDIANRDAATASPSTAATAVQEVWRAMPGTTLRTVLEAWGKRAAWTVIWQSDKDYPLEAPATFTGDFLSATGRLFEGFTTATPAPLGHFYKENQVLVVVSGEEK